MARNYDPVAAGLDKDLTIRLGPIDPVLKRLDSRIAALGKLNLSKQEFDDLYEFVRGGLGLGYSGFVWQKSPCARLPARLVSKLSVL